jgi:hypothetical protein
MNIQYRKLKLKMKTKLLLIQILILTGALVKAQDTKLTSDHDKTYSVNFQLGLNQIKETNLIPLAHQGRLTELSFETEKIKKSLRQFRFSFLYSRIKTEAEEMPKSGNIMFCLDYSFNFLIYQKNNLRYYLGPQASLCYSYMLYPNWDDSHGYWADYLSFGPDNILSLSLKHEREWFTSLSFSLVSIFSRPDEIRQYKMDNSSVEGILKALNSNLESGSLNKALQINFKIEYRFPVFVSKREAITFGMNLIRLSQKKEQPVFQFIWQAGLKIML